MSRRKRKGRGGGGEIGCQGGRGGGAGGEIGCRGGRGKEEEGQEEK